MSDLAEFIEHFRARALQGALAQATAAYWLRRAAQFEAAKPRLGEFHGQMTPPELSAKWQELDAIVRACRGRASIAHLTGESEYAPELVDALAEVAA